MSLTGTHPMRRLLLVVPVLALAAPVRAQCSPAVSKLITDQRYDGAKAEVQSVLKKNDRDDAAMHCMGRLLLEQDDEKAAEWFERAIKIDDKSAAHHLWLANAIGSRAERASKIKQPFLARRIKSEFERAAQLDPTSIDAHHGLIQFYSQAPGIMGGSMDKAKDEAREIEKLNAWRGHTEMGSLLERDKDVAGAEKEFTAALAAAPDTNGAYTALASFYRRQKRWSEALGTYERLLQRKPDVINARLNIAATLIQANQNLDRADREVHAWLAAPPADAPKANMATAHFLLGQIAEKAGKKDAARAEYLQTQTLAPKYNGLKEALDRVK